MTPTKGESQDQWKKNRRFVAIFSQRLEWKTCIRNDRFNCEKQIKIANSKTNTESFEFRKVYRCEWTKLQWTVLESTVLNSNEGTKWSNAGSSTVFAQLLRKVDTGVNIERLNWYWTFRKYRRFIQIIIQRGDGTPRVGGTDKIIIAFAVYHVLTKSVIYQWKRGAHRAEKNAARIRCTLLPFAMLDVR